MNTAAVVSSVVVALLTILGTLLGWWVKRTDRVARMTQANLDDMADNLALVNALKHDFWDLESWAHEVQHRWHILQRQLQSNGVLTEVVDLPPIPESRLARIERKRIADGGAPDEG